MHTKLLAIATALGLASSASALTVVPTFVADPNTARGYTATSEQLHFSAGSEEVDRFQITPPIPGLLTVTIDESPPELGKVFFTNYEVIGGAANSFSQSGDLLEVTFDAVPGLPTGFDQTLHLILTTRRELEQALRDGWPLAVEITDAVRRDDYQVLYDDPVGRKVLRLLRGAARPRERNARG